MSRLSAQRSRAWSELALALVVSVGLHGALFSRGGVEVASPSSWSRVEARLSSPPVPEPKEDALPSRPVSAAPASPAALASIPEVETDPTGPGLVLPSAIRALYRRSDGKERELVWRLDQDHFSLRWRDAEGVRRAEGGLGWAGLSAGVVAEAALAFQIAATRQWLSQSARRSGWWISLEGGGRVRVVETASGTMPAYRIEGAWGWRSLELDARRGYLPVAWTESAAPGLSWRLAWLEDLAQE